MIDERISQDNYPLTPEDPFEWIKHMEEEMGVDTNGRPPTDDIDLDDIPDEWLDGLDDEAPPSPDDLRDLARGIARRAESGQVTLPAKAFARVLLLVAEQMEMLMEWQVMDRPGAEVRENVTRSTYEMRVTIPAHVLDYGPPTSSRHVVRALREGQAEFNRQLKSAGKPQVPMDISAPNTKYY